MNLWTDEQKEMLSELYEAGASFRTIIESINAKFGTAYTRNAAISRVHRMDLPPRQSPIKRKPESVAPMADRTVKADVRPATTNDGYKHKTVDVATLDIRLVDLEPMQCRFACVRVDNEWRFCGHQKKAGSSFCADHHALCWSPRVAPIQQKPLYRERRAA